MCGWCVSLFIFNLIWNCTMGHLNCTDLMIRNLFVFLFILFLQLVFLFLSFFFFLQRVSTKCQGTTRGFMQYLRPVRTV